MMIRQGEASAAVLAFFDAYLVRRSLEETLAYLTETIQWIGTGKLEVACGAGQVRRILEDEFSVDPEGYHFDCRELSETIHSPLSASVLLTARVSRGQDAVELRVTAGCAATEKGCKIASIHASTADGQQQAGEYFPAAAADRREFERLVGVKTLDLLAKSIPGGMMGGYLEQGFPLYFINEQMLCCLGYTYEEFARAIGGLVVNGIHPEDRAQVSETVARAFAENREYEVQYRMKKRDGSYIWVSDVGKKGMAEDGRAVCISVVRDISQEVERKRLLERQAAEKERQARRYDQLFQSVLCGIVQYRLAGRGVAFVNANREAIRIFGYEPEEFWAKTEWDLAALIVPEDRDRVLAEVASLHQVGDKQDYEYRLLQKNGDHCWIIGSAEVLPGEGGTIVQSVFIDIDERKKAEQRNRLLTNQLEASNEVLHAALEHTTTCEFYYDAARRLCTMPGRLCEYYGTAPQYLNMPESFARQCVAPGHRQAFCDMYEAIHQGERTASTEFRMLDNGRWCRQTVSVIRSGEDGAPLYAIGILEDITRQKEMEAALEAARSRDSLTGLYNKEAGVRLVQQALAQKSPEESCGLMLLDMDDFEAINREEGGAFADALLQEVAAILTAEPGEDGIAIRLGGDEFMLFVRDCTKARATLLGPRIAEQVKNIIVRAEKQVEVSVSIGMCVTQVVEEYNALYRCAESTLKYVKEHEKGRAACYLDTSNELGISLTQLYTEEHPVNAIDREMSSREEDLASFALELLGKSKKLDDAVFLLLARVGKNFGLDRVSILSASREFLTLHYDYQWARRRADFQLEQNVYLSAEQFERADSLYDQEGLCEANICPHAAMASCLHAGIWDGGEFVGIMSFEQAAAGRAWTPQERKTLGELVGIVPSFLMKAKADAVSRAKTDFLSRMSHEIRTPMNAISGMTTIAKSVLDDQEKAMECLEKIESANRYLLELINDILDMSRIESGKMELNTGPMDLAAQLAGLKALLQPQAQAKGLTLRVENGYAEALPLVGDSLRLNQVLVNIVGNAIKFTKTGGVVVRVEPVGDKSLLKLRFSVRDTGIGIEPAALGRIFNAFEQAEKSTAARHGGTGLGLAISSRLVQMMGGVLEVKSRVGEGSEFYFTLPFALAPVDSLAPAPTPAAPPAEEEDFTGRRVLLAEDNALNQEIARTILEMHGFCVECAADGQKAVELFCRRQPGWFDAVLMDIRMPVMDGLEATRRIRTADRPDSRTLPIIALTANAFDEDSKKSLESGMNGHLAKPLQVRQMLRTLKDCMESAAPGPARP